MPTPRGLRLAVRPGRRRSPGCRSARGEHLDLRSRGHDDDVVDEPRCGRAPSRTSVSIAVAQRDAAPRADAASRRAAASRASSALTGRTDDDAHRAAPPRASASVSLRDARGAARRRPSASATCVQRRRQRRRAALVGDDPVEQPAVARAPYAARSPAASSVRPAQSMNASVGPLSTAPPTIGRDRDDRRRRCAQRLAHARHGEDRADRDDRVRRADDDRARRGDRVEHLRRRARGLDARRSATSSTGPGAALADHELLERRASRRAPARACAPARRTSAARARATPSARRELGERLRRRARPRRASARRSRHNARSRSPRLNQTSLAELAQRRP